MKRESASSFSKAGPPLAHRFPTVTLMCSVGLLVGGMRLADVLPMPRLPRFTHRTFPEPAPPQSRFPSVGGDASPGMPHQAGFPGSSLPGERITLQDVSFAPIRVPLWPMSSRLIVRAGQGNLSLIDPRTEAVIWLGDIAEAHFKYSSISGTQVLRDGKGQVIWSDVPIPDLLFEKSSTGKARLSDKHGRTLWAGTLSAATNGVARSDHRGTTYTMEFNGIRVNGINGYFTVIDGTGSNTRILWSGTLPLQPVLLFRDDHKYLFWGDGRSESGSDRTTDIRLTQERGSVTIADAREQPLGTQSVDLLKVESSIHLLEDDKTDRVPQQYCIPYGNLAKSGSVLFTYRDGAGIVIRKNSVVRDGDRQRINNNGLPF